MRFSIRGFCLVLLAILGLLATNFSHAQSRGNRPEAVRSITDQALLAREAGDSARELEILEQGINSVGAENRSAFPIYQLLGQYYADRGNAFQALRVAELQKKTAHRPDQEFRTLMKLTSLHASLHQLEKAKQNYKSLQEMMPRLRALPDWQENGRDWQASAAFAGANYHTKAGHLAEAEAAWRTCLSFSESQIGESPERQGMMVRQLECTAGLLGVLVSNGMLVEAGAIVAQQRAEIERVVQASRRPALLYRIAAPLARVAMEQGRLSEAQEILQRALDELTRDSSADASQRVAGMRKLMAMIEMLEGHWEKALIWHEARADALKRAGDERGNVGAYSPEYAYNLIRLGRADEALVHMERIVKGRRDTYDDKSLYAWEGQAFYGVALAAVGQKDAALKALRVAIPKVLELSSGERSAADAGLLRTVRLGWLLDGYLMLLADVASEPNNPDRSFAINESFVVADVARGSVVQRALAIAASRAKISDPALVELAERERDLQREIGQLSDGINNLLSRARVLEQDKVVAEMRTNLGLLRKQHEAVSNELTRKFPDYANLITPKPVELMAAQRALKAGEAMLSVFPGSAKTLLWAIPQQGAPVFSAVPVTADELSVSVRRLRKTVDPSLTSGNDLPAFDTKLAYRLYTQLLQPVEKGWQGARELIVIPHGELGQLPLAILLTAAWHQPPQRLPYAELASAPWLLNKVAISQLPSVVAFSALRNGRAEQAVQRPFFGIGDPLFTLAKETAATRGIHRRNLSIRSAADSATEINFKLLPQLPDTAIELNEIAKVFTADTARDILLQARATESGIKQTDLSAYRVIMFATHGLMNGEMPGLYQPALALSNPKLTNDSEDGMLTMEEILGLKLRADWVVLSACNTAASDGAVGGLESFSGLGRAFFFAGARALLATSWAVETESARMLTTDIFKRQLANPVLSRSLALQQASMALMKKSAGNDYSYAHPMFWAPYVLMGDGS